jgi:gliding motility-associated protein GldC
MENTEIVKTRDITIRVGLNSENMPMKIEWSAQDMHPHGVFEECKAMSVALFDKEQRDTLRIDLWTKELQVMEMDNFMFKLLQSLSGTYLKATQNKEMAEDLARFAHYFGQKTEIIPKEG